MVLLFPVPGAVASMIQGVQTEKMKKTDARVQNVTESESLPYTDLRATLMPYCVTAMSVIRMVKLFGWEPRVADQLGDKREDELKYIRKNKILELINNNIKYVESTAILCCSVLIQVFASFVIPIVTMVATFVTYVSAIEPSRMT